MTLRFAESFDNATNGTGITSRGWTFTTYCSFTSSGGRTGGGGITNITSSGTTTGAYRTMNLGGDLVRTALWWKATTPVGGGSWMIRWSNAAAGQHGGVQTDAGGHVLAIPWGSGAAATAIATGSINVCDGGWHYIETECLFAAAGGSFKVWVDGTLEVAVAGDTLDSGTVSLDVLRVCVSIDTSAIDDVLVWDDTGADLTGDLGGRTYLMQTLRPTSDAGVQFARSTGSANYACVDEAQLSTTDYVEDGTSGHVDRYGYGFGDTGLTSEAVKAVIVEAVAANPGAGSISCAHDHQSGRCFHQSGPR